MCSSDLRNARPIGRPYGGASFRSAGPAAIRTAPRMYNLVAGRFMEFYGIPQNSGASCSVVYKKSSRRSNCVGCRGAGFEPAGPLRAARSSVGCNRPLCQPSTTMGTNIMPLLVLTHHLSVICFNNFVAFSNTSALRSNLYESYPTYS